jgi:hypothetical protein
MKILAIDPGTTESAYVVFDGEEIIIKRKDPNSNTKAFLSFSDADILVIEMIASYGMPVGKEVFETCVFIGRMIEKWKVTSEPMHKPCILVYRKDIKMHICGTMKAKDGNIRQALIDRFGEPGTKKNPGKTYGISSDIWQALAVAVYAYDNMEKLIKNAEHPIVF